ncbi:MAG: hypothetical protein A3D24_04255 [Candidatus Blackburnbacteria bacterium RIFCSPHIGHO2_02_FULL_39_13]|uniref:Glycosyltransferase RgtA/B/C/D-like domain-containing protein n=1 Tax=Candidatus Blackburnbacteria bacterium RIFCSPLOWO2_01_FULL_40_20 TaxID=1797519 RepID=A0A1G1VAH9_9BACT|nr:MAG: Glycosyl transferase family 39 [Microgenomates group bacterium GW2011_GWA2_39_19]OGY07389.1 MAG: hypothetical protein A2694_02030 [Candidatus Blackburnbacteria bacterium RIFCSPHIGHO2_01_FULL_40_17]OGY09869.1 MAG: hypothetical protein A3D24_04255 [Candidatus Blackburnbacteria bacterium RIFCSPHIGHO2_02_FULL_39_13]OGY12458.1 MAG: hypothetical protein A3A77_00575 [Candidatus Blackburnbacteria bacterium RIFCSPLOWO2_01_FULL_40_20]HBL52318.1 hypothetical protein [Candidatus Blackburnbacteria b
MKKIIFQILLFFISISPFILSNYLLFLKDPPIWPDEPVFLNMANNLVTIGKLAMNIVGDPNAEQSGGGYPPLYFYILGVWTSTFGNSIETVRSMSLLLAFFSLLVFFLLANKIFNNFRLAAIGTFILSLDVHFSRSSRTGRMEILTFFFFLLSILLLLCAQKSKKFFWYLFSGFAAALATLSHAAGFVAPIVLMVGELTVPENNRKKLCKILILIIPTVLLNLIWIVSKKGSVDFIASAFSIQFQDKASKIPYIFVLFQSDFSWCLLFLAYATIIATSLILLIKFFKREHLFILTGSIVSAMFVIFGKEGGYIIYLQPFIVLNIIYVLTKRVELINETAKIGIVCLALIVIVSYINIQFFNNDNIGITRSGVNSIWDSKNYNYHQFSNEIAEKLPKNKNLTLFLSAAPDPYFDLVKNSQYRIYEMVSPSAPLSDSLYKKLLDSTDYIIFTWIPHQYLADYINKNKEEFIHVGQEDTYQATIVKLKPLKDRI